MAREIEREPEAYKAKNLKELKDELEDRPTIAGIFSVPTEEKDKERECFLCREDKKPGLLVKVCSDCAGNDEGEYHFLCKRCMCFANAVVSMVVEAHMESVMVRTLERMFKECEETEQSECIDSEGSMTGYT